CSTSDSLNSTFHRLPPRSIGGDPTQPRTSSSAEAFMRGSLEIPPEDDEDLRAVGIPRKAENGLDVEMRFRSSHFRLLALDFHLSLVRSEANLDRRPEVEFARTSLAAP